MLWLKTKSLTLLLLLLLSNMLAFNFLIPPQAHALDIKALIRYVEQQYHGSSSYALTTMQMRTANWERTLDMESWALGQDYFMVRILQPAKERGVATLKRDVEVWNYLPKIDRTIKVPPSMMGGSWMGSHITNDDLVKANHIEEDYIFRLLEETSEYWLVEGIARPTAAVVWGKIVYRIRKQPKVPEQIDYYDEEQILVRSFHFEDVRKIDGRDVPMLMTVTPLDKPEEQTILRYNKLDFDVPIDKSFFNLRSLKQR